MVDLFSRVGDINNIDIVKRTNNGEPIHGRGEVVDLEKDPARRTNRTQATLFAHSPSSSTPGPILPTTRFTAS